VQRLYILFAAIYLIEGITEVPFILSVYLRNILEFEPSQIGRILFLGGIWFVVVKPVVGLLADSWRRFSTRWALLFGLACSAGGWALIANAGTPLAMGVGVSLKILAIAILDVLIDGMIVTASNSRNRSFIQSLVYGCRFGGAMLTANIAGGMIGDDAAVFVQIYYFYSLLAVAALLPVLIYRRADIEAGREQGGDGQLPVVREPLRTRLAQLKNPAFGWLLALLFLYSLGADTATYFDPLLEERYSGDFLGLITTVYYAGILAGIFAFPLLRFKISVRALLIISLVGWSAVEISSLSLIKIDPGGSVNLLGGAIYGLGGFFNAFSGIALLTVATAMCKIRGIETFAFAAAISVKNLTDQSSVLFGGYIMEAVGLEMLFVISCLAGFLPFLVLFKLNYSEV
jgi:predicted MFS family arabinose efflux permease